jgi:glycosyltransferase involved in cell wall biosynthesis
MSLVMAYHNRPKQLQITLESIEFYCKNTDNLEIIIIDDASDAGQTAEEAIQSFKLPIRVQYIPLEEHWWINPCVPFNMGIKQAQGDIVCLQTPECVHVDGDLLGYFRDHVTNQNYLTTSCLTSLTEIPSRYPQFSLLATLDGIEMNQGISNLIRIARHKCWAGRKYHFLSAMTKSNMDQLGGFDETYADGYAYDDDEFLFRAEESGLDVQLLPPIVGYVVHQWHEKNPKYSGGCPEWFKNQDRYRELVQGKREVH